jgi:RNA polymerase sigma factor (sigma-70 family)
LSEDADIEAVRLAKDDRAFERLYDSHTPYLYRFALRLAGGDEPLAAELVHDAWVTAVERLARFERRSTFRVWLGGILVNRARLSWRENERDHIAIDEVPIGVSDAALDFTLHRVDLERAMSRLPDRARHVFVMHDVEGYTHEDIAELLGIEPGTSKSQLSRARALLRARLEDTRGASS